MTTLKQRMKQARKRDQECKKAYERFESIKKKCGGDKKRMNRMIGLRTDRMTNPVKLQVWSDHLEFRGFESESMYAHYKGERG